MADERPPIEVQLSTEYLATDASDKGLIGVDDALWNLSTMTIT
ncbi:hypothetical protein N692_09200 [Lactiplantibacillus plantarum EGD-AQ4]|nr:hypothetical protein N692_09200 [Lactiplantibacillus plantarum EGD-AQ4]